jgi:signal transduction histidine kinase/ligand-binding sensor domain-containing protein/DNA-binding response OmpR family regulator
MRGILLFLFLNFIFLPSLRGVVNYDKLSHLHIRDFCQDSLGYMWIATTRGLNRYNGYDFKQFSHNKKDEHSLENDIANSLLLDSRHRLWIGTGTGVNQYDFRSERFIHYEMPNMLIFTFHEDKEGDVWVATHSFIGKINEQTFSVEIYTDPQFQLDGVNVLLEDSRGRFWAGTGKGLVNIHHNQWTLIPLPDDRKINCICLDPQGIFMIGTNSGFAFFDPATQNFLDIPALLSSNRSLNQAHIHFIKEITPLKYLIGTSSEGLYLYDALRHTLEQNPIEYTEALNSQQLLCCEVDDQGNVWIGSFDKGFAVYSNKLPIFNRNLDLNNTFKNIFTTRVIEDRYKNLWAGTRYQGVYHYNTHNHHVRIYDHRNFSTFKGKNNLVEELYIDMHGYLWIVCEDRILAGSFDETGNYSLLRQISLADHPGSASIAEDHQGNLWFGLAYGLFVIRKGDVQAPFENIHLGNFTKVYPLSGGELLCSIYNKGIYRINGDFSLTLLEMPTLEATLLSQHCIDLFEDDQKRLWLGSYNEGTMYIRGDEYRIFDMADGLPSNDIIAIRADNDGNIWMSTTYGLSCMNPDYLVTNYFEYDGTQGDQYHEKASLLNSDGLLFFTGNHGLTFFDPYLITPNSTPPLIVIEDLKIKNESVRPEENGNVLDCNISYTGKIVLDHTHTLFSIDYSGIDFLNPRRLTYAYKLNGFDQDWNHVGDFRRATYSNLKPGRYTFTVTAFNRDGLECLHPATLEIEVKAAPWFAWWAFLFYFILFGATIYAFMYLRIKVKLQKQRLELDHYEHEREREVTEMKMTFYTNISHELRTPLTLISAPVQQLLAGTDPESKDGKLLQTISRNRNRLHRLIDQLLDFRKIEDGILALKVRQSDILHEISAILDDYISSASGKGIDIEYTFCEPPPEIWYDPDKIEKIMHNLLSNALKHTPPNNKIRITVQTVSFAQIRQRYNNLTIPEEKYIEISVANNGEGVPPHKLDEIFERYRQVESPTGRRPDYAGMGIGLHYAGKLTEVHHGSITAELLAEGGMIFSFLLPLGDVYSSTEKDSFGEETEKFSDPEDLPETEDLESSHRSNTALHEYTVLIAEDNIELMVYFRQMLGDRYNIMEALDGIRAWELIQKQYPDLVLSDVIMPKLSGYELCARIKQDPASSHIPVILLTAKTSMVEQIEGLSYGADAYICKPFNVDYLLLTIENRLRNREKLRTFYSTPQLPDDRDEIPIRMNTLDHQFMEKLMKILESKLYDSELSIDELAREMTFSRTSFYRKLKGLTNIAPADFIRNYRLKRAAEMILEGSWNLSEIADKTGFTNYAHFSVLFKKHFDVSPKNYKKSRENKK